MTCAEFRYMIDDYFARKVTGRDKDEFDAHLVSCYNCQVEFEKYKQLFKDIDQLPSNYEAPETLYEQISIVIGRRITETHNQPIFPRRGTDEDNQRRNASAELSSKSKKKVIPEEPVEITKTTSRLMQNLIIILILALSVLLVFLSYQILKS